MNFETLLLRVILVAALVAVFCLASLALSAYRRRRLSVLTSPAFRSAHVQPTQKAEPFVASILPRVSANPTREWERQTNSGMY